MAFAHQTGGTSNDTLKKAIKLSQERDRIRRSKPSPRPTPSYTPRYSAPKTTRVSQPPKHTYQEKPDPSRFIDKINSAYDKSKSALLKSYMANQQHALRGLNQQKDETQQAAYDNRNQTAVQKAQALKSLLEQMAAYGQAQSGENVSGQVSINTGYENALGDINAAEQNALSDISNQISSVTDPSKKNSLIANLESARDQALASQMWNEHQAQLAEKARQEQLALQREQIAAANARAAAAARASAARAAAQREQAAQEMKYNHMLDVWKLSGRAPEGFPGVDPGTPLYEGMSSQSSPSIGAKESKDNYYSAIKQLEAAEKRGFSPEQRVSYVQSMKPYLSPNDYADLLDYINPGYN